MSCESVRFSVDDKVVHSRRLRRAARRTLFMRCAQLSCRSRKRDRRSV